MGLHEYVAAWCDEALKQVLVGRKILHNFNKRRDDDISTLKALVARAKTDPVFADRGLVRQGVAATLGEFEQSVRGCLAYENFKEHAQFQKTQDAFGTRVSGRIYNSSSPGKLLVGANQGEYRFGYEVTQSLVTSEKLISYFDSLADEIRNTREIIRDASEDKITQLQQTSLPELLDMVKGAAATPPATQVERPSLYVPEAKRGKRVGTALWTLGILFVAALIFHLIGWFVFAGALLFFVVSAVVTSNTDLEEENSRVERANRDKALKDNIEKLDLRARELMSGTLAEIIDRLNGASEVATDLGRVLRGIASETVQTKPPTADVVFGECTISPLIDHVTRKEGNPDFADYADPEFYLKCVQERPHVIEDCLAHMPLGECDEIDVVVAQDDSQYEVGRYLTSAILMASQPGQARFMFVEPGRLAEAYRVFGALNESAATRLADRLYITQLNELATAVDSLRTFVGRTKEAMTRQADANRRITDQEVGNKGTILLQRAIVVLDETQRSHWPQKDQRRVLEYYDEIKALSQVGAREGSVLLIRLRQPVGTPEADLPVTSERTIRVNASSSCFTFSGDIRAAFNDAESAASIATACDLWAKAAKKADSTLHQTGATLDWSDKELSDSRYGLEIDIGRHGADRSAQFILGREGAHHAICIGRTGSGKTNLFHVIISNLVRRYSPDELELYLLDFKEGVEFAVYADLALPHCRAVAIDADRGFGLSVLTHLKRELNRRANIFKAAGVGIASLERYEEATGNNMPRIVLLIDEFQVLLQAGERTPGAASGAAAAALEDLVRRGRSFGLHVILGSQTLAGRELTAATLGQLAMRIVLPCSAPDAAMLLGDQPISNQLRAPGDAIIWRAGQGEVSDSHLAKIFAADLDDLPKLAATSRDHASADGRTPPVPFVFRGSGQNELTEMMPHLKAVKAEQRDANAGIFALGAPTTFGDRPFGALRNTRARNVLFVHRSDDTRSGFFYSAVESLLALQSDCQAVICDLEQSTDFSNVPLVESLAKAFNGRVRVVQPTELEAEIEKLIVNLSAPHTGLRTVFGIAGAGRTNLVRSAAFSKLLKEGSEFGLHVIATCDGVKNMERLIERSTITEFGIRGLGSCSASDSQKLLDTNDAESLSAEHQYLILDDMVPGRLMRLQVLTPSLQSDTVAIVSESEAANA